MSLNISMNSANLPTVLDPCSNPVLPTQTLGIVFTLHCSRSLTYMNEYLAIDSGGYLCTISFRELIAAWLDTSLRSRDGVWFQNRSAGV